MANTSSRATAQPLDLNQLYGIDETFNASQPNMDTLVDYGLASSTQNTENNAVQSHQASQNTPQNAASMYNGSTLNNSQSLTQTLPQRQDQTFPTNREPITKPNNGNAQQEISQTEGNLRALLRGQIGQNVKVQFLVGPNSLVEQAGTLVGVGEDYIIWRENSNGELLIGNIDDIKFIRVEK